MKISIMYKFDKSNIRIKWNRCNKAAIEIYLMKEKIVNHNGKKHKNDANKTQKNVHLNIIFVFISFCQWPVIEFCFLWCAPF